MRRFASTHHDRGSTTPLLVAVLALLSLVTLSMSQVAQSAIDVGRATTAAEVLALAAVMDADLESLAAEHDVDDFTIAYDDGSTTVQATRNGVIAQASAIDHRRTLEVAE